jgi:ubiquinone/menaquinone biosynthesis C-methylase UbiE
MTDNQTIEYYRKRAAEYDKIYYRDNPRRQAELSRMYELSRKVLSRKEVLDLACGTGFWTREISQSAESIVGVDINAATLEEARQKSYRCPVRFLIADFFSLPFERPLFTGLLATFVLSHVRREDQEELCDHVKRSLAPNTTAFFCENNQTTEMPGNLHWDNSRTNTYKLRKLENGEEFRILKNYYDESELRDTLGRWGSVEELIYDYYYWAAVVRIS